MENRYNVSICLVKEYEDLAKIRVEQYCKSVNSSVEFSVEDYLRSLLNDALIRDKILYDECKAELID